MIKSCYVIILIWLANLFCSVYMQHCVHPLLFCFPDKLWLIAKHRQTLHYCIYCTGAITVC